MQIIGLFSRIPLSICKSVMCIYRVYTLSGLRLDDVTPHGRRIRSTITINADDNTRSLHFCRHFTVLWFYVYHSGQGRDSHHDVGTRAL